MTPERLAWLETKVKPDYQYSQDNYEHLVGTIVDKISDGSRWEAVSDTMYVAWLVMTDESICTFQDFLVATSPRWDDYEWGE